MADDQVQQGLVGIASWGFVVRKAPWCISVLSLDNLTVGEPLSISWVTSSRAVLVDSPEASRILPADQKYGDLGLMKMLNPAWLAEVAPISESRQFSIPGKVIDERHDLLPELVSLGTDRYETEVSEDLGVLLSWSAIINNLVATERRVTILGFGALSESLGG